MHAPDGFLNAATAVTTGAISATAISAGLRVTGRDLSERQVPLAGLAAAFVFAGQMMNFPVAAGTTGHLLGGALAAILLGPHLGALVVTVVVVVQALLFADGGLTALGYNILNMAIVPAYGGYALFVLGRKILPKSGASVVVAAAVAAMLSVVLSALAFSLEFALGGTATGIDPRTVTIAMVGVHVLIGLGEAAITGATVGSVMAVRPDLVHGARHLDAAGIANRAMKPLRPFLIGGAIITVLIAGVGSQFAAGSPDGLERVAQEQGFDSSAVDSAVAEGPLADYDAGLGSDGASVGVAGLVGVATIFVLAAIALTVVRRRGAPELEPIDLTVGEPMINLHDHDHQNGHVHARDRTH